jgi:curved DNA-binding protein CbpA
MCDDRLVATLYEILGVTDDATDEELRRAYLRAARRLHPDVNPDAGATEEMRRLNRAWAVLGDADSRRSYDLERRRAVVAAPSAASRPAADPEDPHDSEDPHDPEDPDEMPLVHPLARVVRPSALILAVLLIIFVVTAYAGPRSSDRNPAPASSTPPPGASPLATVPGPASPFASPTMLGKCVKILPGYDAVVPCSQPSDGQIVAEVVASAQCPAATRAYQLAGRAQIVCLDRAGP